MDELGWETGDDESEVFGVVVDIGQFEGYVWKERWWVLGRSSVYCGVLEEAEEPVFKGVELGSDNPILGGG